MTGERDAPAEMPGVEEIARVLFEFATCTDIAKGPAALDANAGPFARAILALFAPILAEKERMRAAAISAEERLGEMIDASKEEWSKHGATEMALGQWKARAEEAENGRNEWRRLFSEERSSHAALEARALAAEANFKTVAQENQGLIDKLEAAETALAAERERCASYLDERAAFYRSRADEATDPALADERAYGAEACEKVFAALKSATDWCRPLLSFWIIQTERTPSEVITILRNVGALDEDDGVVVLEITGKGNFRRVIDQEVADWLNARIIRT